MKLAKKKYSLGCCRMWLLVAAGLLLVACDQQPSRFSDARYPMKAKEVAPGVYAVITPARDFPNPENKGWNSNAGFIVTEEGVLVFDTGSSETIGKVLKATIRGITDKPVKWIINSHGHGDHWLGNKAVAEKGTEIIATSKVQHRIDNEGHEWIDRFNRMTKGETGESGILAPNTIVDEKSERDFGGVKAELIPSGDSHSPGDIVLWLPELKVLMAGDVVIADRAPGTFDSNIPQWIRFLAELEALKPNVVIPGHGGVHDVGAITELHDFFQQLWDIVAQGYKDGQQDFEIATTVRRKLGHYADTMAGFDRRIGETVSHVYLQVEESAF